MRVRAYIWIRSTEGTVRAVHRDTQLEDATVKKLKSRNSKGEDLWSWGTAQIPIDWHKADEELNKMLLLYRPIFPKIEKYQGPDADIYLEVVTEYETGDDPQGFYLSAETIKLMSELGCAFDNDVYGFRKP